jgi:hypothetical protein
MPRAEIEGGSENNRPALGNVRSAERTENPKHSWETILVGGENLLGKLLDQRFSAAN